MTLILALHCQDGVVLASDSQATLATSGQATKQDVDKLQTIVGHLGWGASGTGGLIQRVQAKLALDQGLSKVFEKDGAEAGAQRLHRIVHALQKEAAENFVALPGIPGQPEHVAGIFAGLARGAPFILEIGINSSRHFVASHSAIGSGDVFATAAMGSVSHYKVRSLNLERALALAYRTVDDAIQNAAHGLGGRVQMLAVTKDKTWCLTKEEIEPIKDLVGIWKQQEAEVLGKLSRTPDADQPAPDPPSEADGDPQ